MAIYNSISASDSSHFELIRATKEFPLVKFLEIAGNNTLRTGKLYQAYKAAVDYAHTSGFSMVNLIQADMQMVNWRDTLAGESRRLLDLKPNGDDLFTWGLFTQIPQRGKRIDYFGNWRSDLVSGQLAIRGHADVGIFDVDSFRSKSFDFDATEQKNSQQLGEAGAVLIHHPVPFLAAIPFPATVRGGKVIGRELYTRNSEGLILEVNSDVEPHVSVSESRAVGVFMEDFIYRRDWLTLTPYWVSDTTGLNWIRVRLDLVRRGQVRLFQQTRSERSGSYLRLRSFLRNYFLVIRGLTALVITEVAMQVRRIARKQMSND